MIYSNNAFKGGYFDIGAFRTALTAELGFQPTSNIDTSTRLVTGTTATVIHTVSLAVAADELAIGFFNANVSQNLTPPIQSQIILIADGKDLVTENHYFSLYDTQVSARGSVLFSSLMDAEGKESGQQTRFEAQAKSVSGAGSEFRVFSSLWLILVGKKQRYNDRLFA